MKTQSKGFARFLKNIAIFTFTGALLFSCGSDNKSNNTNRYGSFGFSNYSGINAGSGINLNTALGQLAQANPCRLSPNHNQYPHNNQNFNNYNNMQRTKTSFNPNYLPNAIAGVAYLGVTAEGDIAVAYTSNQGQAVVDIYTCARPDAQQVTNATYPALGGNPQHGTCSVGQIGALNAIMPSQTGYTYDLRFYSPLYGNSAGLCQRY